MKKTLLFIIVSLTISGGLQAQSSTWNTTGNSFPSLSADTYFLGTTNSYPLRFRTNNSDRMYISTSGNVGVGAMNALLLEKVEELTRYVIDLQNQIDELKKGKE